jgi:ABC-type transport system substrate-binding protein
VSACNAGSTKGGTADKVPPLTIQLGAALPPDVPGIGVSALVAGLTGETLVTADRVGRMQGRLCERVEWKNAGTVLQLTLAPNVLFHDGTLLNAQFLAEFLRARFKTERRASYTSITKVETPTDTVVEIHLSRPEAFLVEDLGDFMVTRDKARTIGTGPFMVEPDATTSLRAFEQYRRGRAEVDRVELKPYPTLRGAWTAMMRGEINMLYEVGREAADFVDVESSVATYAFLRAYYLFVGFNVRHAILKRRDVRQALSQAIDRDAIVRGAMRGRGEVADSPIWKYHWTYNTTQRMHRYNVDAARLRLDAAGFPARQASVAGAMPSRFRFKCLTWGNDARFEQIGLVLQKQLYDIGVDMEIETVPLNALGSRMAAGDFDAFLFEMNSGRMLTWVYRTWHSPIVKEGFLDTGYRAADATLDRLRHSTSDSATRSAVANYRACLRRSPAYSWRGPRSAARSAPRSTYPRRPTRTFLAAFPASAAGSRNWRNDEPGHHVAVRAHDRDGGDGAAADLRRIVDLAAAQRHTRVRS